MQPAFCALSFLCVAARRNNITIAAGREEGREGDTMNEPYYNCFKKGFRVEVCLDEVGFRGSWYTATILENPSKKSLKLFLEFDDLVDEHNPTKPLRQRVHFILVRPLPPLDHPNAIFHLDDDVDAFHNDGWWEGVVTGVLPASSNAATPRYSVFFRSSREQIDFPASELRLHREWCRGEWVPPLSVENPVAAADSDQTTQPISSPSTSSLTPL